MQYFNLEEMDVSNIDLYLPSLICISRVCVPSVQMEKKKRCLCLGKQIVPKFVGTDVDESVDGHLC